MLHLKDLGVDITTEELRFFLLDAGLAKDASLDDDEMDGKAAASCRTPNKKRQPRLPLFEPSHTSTRMHYTTRLGLGPAKLSSDLLSYQRARMRYFSVEVPSLATGTMNWAAKAAVFVYLWLEETISQ